MNTDLMNLLKATEQRCDTQQKIIQNQEIIISNLTKQKLVLEQNVAALTEKNQALCAALEHASTICENQQQLLDAVFCEQQD